MFCFPTDKDNLSALFHPIPITGLSLMPTPLQHPLYIYIYIHLPSGMRRKLDLTVSAPHPEGEPEQESGGGMATLQRSAVSFPTQGSSGPVRDE